MENDDTPRRRGDLTGAESDQETLKDVKALGDGSRRRYSRMSAQKQLIHQEDNGNIC